MDWEKERKKHSEKMSKSVKGKSKAVTVLIQNEAKADGEFYSTQGFESRESDDEDPETKLWDVVDILDERNGFFLIKWAGVDEHGEPWKNSWVPRVDVTDDLVKEWRMKKATATKMKGLEKGKGKDTRRKSVGRPPKSQGMYGSVNDYNLFVSISTIVFFPSPN